MNDNASSRFHLQSIRHAKNVAKNAKGFLETLGYDVKLSQAQGLVAALYGHKGWHDLERSVHPGMPVGPVDSQLSPEALAARRERHMGVLAEFGISHQASTLFLDKCAPTAGQPILARELLWTTSAIGIMECAKSSFMPAMRIYKGRLDNDGLDFLEAERVANAKADPSKLTLPGYSVFAGDSFIHPIAEGATLEEVKEEAEFQWREAQVAERELNDKNRETSTVDYEWRVGKNNAYQVEKVTEIADGLLHLHTDSFRTYVLAYPEWLRRLPDVFRPSNIEEGVPHIFYLDEAGQIFPLCFPELFTRHEVETAVKIAKYAFPAAYEAFVLGDAADDLCRARGSRGFATTGRDYYRVSDLEDMPNGDKLVLAFLETVWGDDFDEAEFGKLYIFRIRADQLEEFEARMGEIDETIHALEGIYHQSLEEYRQAEQP